MQVATVGAWGSQPIAPSCGAALRAHLRAAGRRAGLPPARTEALVLAAWEALVNAVSHGRATPEVVVTGDPERLTVTVIDRGGGPLLVPTVQALPEPMEEHGRGIALLVAGADEVHARPSPEGHRLELVVRR